jgi:hypothetical protein
MDAVSKRLKPTLAASAAAALKTKSKPSTLASVMDRKIINGVFEPVVFVDKLTYDWSSLKLDGAAAWNALLKQKMFDNPALYKSIPQVTAMDTFRLAQGLKDALQTIQPPENSPLHKVTNESVSSSTFVPSIASDCPDDLLALFPKLATVYHDMVMQDCALMDRESTSILLRSYQYMTADEVRAHLAEAELDVTTLAAQQEEILHTSQQLGLFAKNVSDEKREGRKTKHGAVAATEVDGVVVAVGNGSADDAFWEADFAALLKQNGVDPATRYVMAHDQF